MFVCTRVSVEPFTDLEKAGSSIQYFESYLAWFF